MFRCFTVCALLFTFTVCFSFLAFLPFSCFYNCAVAHWFFLDLPFQALWSCFFVWLSLSTPFVSLFPCFQMSVTPGGCKTLSSVCSSLSLDSPDSSAGCSTTVLHHLFGFSCFLLQTYSVVRSLQCYVRTYCLHHTASL